MSETSDSMLVFLHVEPAIVHVAVRAEGDGMVGDLFRDVGPGDQFAGYSFDELSTMGSGMKRLVPRPPSPG